MKGWINKELQNRKKIRERFLYAITFIIMILLIYYIFKNRDDFTVLINIPPLQLVGLVMFSMLASLINGLYVKFLADSIGKKVDVVGWMGVKCMGGLANSILPMRAGTVFEAFYFKKVYELSYSSYISFSAGNIVISLLGQLITFTVVFGILSIATREVEIKIAIAMTVLLIIFIAALVMVLKWKEKLLRYIPFKKYLLPVVRGFIELFDNKKLIGQLSLLFVFSLISISGKYMICFEICGMPSRFSIAFLYGAVTILLSFCAFLPSNWGVMEIVLGAVTFVLGEAFNNGILLSLLGRVGALIGYLCISVIFSYPVLKKMKEI